MSEPGRPPAGMNGTPAHTRPEGAFKAFELIFQSLVEALPQSVFCKDREGRFIFGNKKWCETLGKNPAEFLGKTDFDFYPPELAEKYRQDDRKVIESGRLLDTLEKHTTPSGAEMYVHVVKAPLLDEEGQVIGVQGIFCDESQRWLAEKQATDTLNLLRATLEATSVGLLVVDRQGKVVSYNQLFAEMWRIPEALLRTRDDARLIGYVLDQLIDPDLFLRKIQQLYHHHEPSLDELHFKDGRVFERYSHPYRISGEPMGRVWSFRDITERKRWETAVQMERDLLQALLDNMPDTVYFKDAQLRFTRVNPAQARALGLASPAEAVGKTDADFFNPEHVAAARADEERIMATGQPIMDKVERLRRPDGQWRWISATKVPRCDGAGRVIGIIGVSRDITQRKIEEEERATLERKLLDAQKLESLGVLAGGVAHDFNNLLAAIMGNAGLAAMELPEQSSVRRYLTHVEKISLQASGLCDQMLAYAGRSQMQTQRLNLNVLIEEMTQLLQISISKKSVLRLHLETNLPAVVADPSQVRQVIFNLVTNASEAIGDKSGVIRIGTGLMRADRAYLTETYLSPDLPAGDYVFVEVSDSGCGMDTATKAKIFDPFFTTKFKGRGLGLAAVLGIVRSHQGAMKVYSEVGKGTTFKFLLPSSSGEPQPAAVEPPASARWKGRGTILIADDEQSLLATVARQIESFGFKTVLAGDGRQAVEIFSRNADEIRLVLLDMTMPHLGGFEAFQEIRRIKSNAKVVLMSGYTEEDATSNFAGRELAGFLHKPFKTVELREKLREILEG